MLLSCTGGKRHKHADSEDSTYSDGQTDAEHKEGASAAKDTDLAAASKADSKADSKNKRLA